SVSAKVLRSATRKSGRATSMPMTPTFFSRAPKPLLACWREAPETSGQLTSRGFQATLLGTRLAAGRALRVAFVPGFDHDVFVIYAHVDNERSGWVTKLVKELEVRLAEQLGGHPRPSVWMDHK